MPTFTGNFQYLNEGGEGGQSGKCCLTFDAETLTLAPADGPPLAFDLGDIDRFAPGDYDLRLTLYTGRTLVLNQFGKPFQDLCHNLLQAYRRHLVQCLLLEDLDEIVRYDGFARIECPDDAARSFASPAEIRLYKSNLAVLPTTATGLQWRLADIDSTTFDLATWALKLTSGSDVLTFSKLAKRTEEFADRLKDQMAALDQQSAKIVHNLFPLLNPDQSQQVVRLMKEGQAVSIDRLRAIHAKAESVLLANTVDGTLKPYFDYLLARATSSGYYAGFKLVRKEDDGASGPGDAESAAAEAASATAGAQGSDQETATRAAAGQGDEQEQPVLYWFLFPLGKQGAKTPGNVVAWEATSRSGRATYFFRLLPEGEAPQLNDPALVPPALEAGIRQLNRALVSLNFRREPIYLSNESLESQARFQRYVIASRKIPELSRLRSSFLGRARHTSFKTWEAQVESILRSAL